MDRRNKADGRQPLCRDCKSHWEKARRGGWCRFQAMLEKKYPELLPAWSEDKYNHMMDRGGRRGRDTCQYCGNNVTLFAGYCIDRVDNAGKYTHDNVAPCCPNCNRFKGAKSREAIERFVRELEQNSQFIDRNGLIIWAAVGRGLLGFDPYLPELPSEFPRTAKNVAPTTALKQPSLFPLTKDG